MSATVPPARRECGFNSIGLLDLHPRAGNPSGIPDFLLDLHPPAGNPSGNLSSSDRESDGFRRELPHIHIHTYV
jgi:hypothetical protein